MVLAQAGGAEKGDFLQRVQAGEKSWQKSPVVLQANIVEEAYGQAFAYMKVRIRGTQIYLGLLLKGWLISDRKGTQNSNLVLIPGHENASYVEKAM